MEVALGHDAEGTSGGENPLSAIRIRVPSDAVRCSRLSAPEAVPRGHMSRLRRQRKVKAGAVRRSTKGRCEVTGPASSEVSPSNSLYGLEPNLRAGTRASKDFLTGAAGVGAAIVAGHYLEVLMPRAAVAVFVLDAGIGEPDVPIVVRQIVFTCPPRNLFGLTVRPAVAVLRASVALVEESLIVALQLVVEDDAPDPAASAP